MAGENWGAIIYDYKKYHKYTPEQALKIVNQRIRTSTRGSVAYKKLCDFRREVQAEIASKEKPEGR